MAERGKGHHELAGCQNKLGRGTGESPRQQDPQAGALPSAGLHGGQGWWPLSCWWLSPVFHLPSPTWNTGQDPTESLIKARGGLLPHIKDPEPPLVTRSKQILDVSRPPPHHEFQSDAPSTPTRSLSPRAEGKPRQSRADVPRVMGVVAELGLESGPPALTRFALPSPHTCSTPRPALHQGLSHNVGKNFSFSVPLVEQTHQPPNHLI